MNKKSILGISVILLISFLPVVLLFAFGPKEPLTDYGIITHKLGQMAALVGMTMMALTFLLSTRDKLIEDIFGGLDKVYRIHGVLGGTALALLLFHPILLVMKFIPQDMGLAADYLLPSDYWSVNFGIIALLGLIALVVATLYMVKMKYQRWKFSHEFMGLVFIFAVLHIFLVRTTAARDYIFAGYYWYAAFVSAIGIAGFSYSLFLRRKVMTKEYSIKSITMINDDVFDIIITPKKEALKYKAGQFVFLKFHNKHIPKESHPFSIASASDNKEIRIIIKNLGDFTSKLSALNPGDKVIVEGPYGRFAQEKDKEKDQVWIAGGIGITPFIGMAKDMENNKERKNRIDLYYSIRDKSQRIALEELESITKVNKRLRIFLWDSSVNGHISLDIIRSKSGSIDDKSFYLCGPDPMKKCIIDDLIISGVKKDNIHSEEFRFR